MDALSDVLRAARLTGDVFLHAERQAACIQRRPRDVEGIPGDRRLLVGGDAGTHSLQRFQISKQRADR